MDVEEHGARILLADFVDETADRGVVEVVVGLAAGRAVRFVGAAIGVDEPAVELRHDEIGLLAGQALSAPRRFPERQDVRVEVGAVTKREPTGGAQFASRHIRAPAVRRGQDDRQLARLHEHEIAGRCVTRKECCDEPEKRKEPSESHWQHPRSGHSGVVGISIGRNENAAQRAAFSSTCRSPVTGHRSPCACYWSLSNTAEMPWPPPMHIVTSA